MLAIAGRPSHSTDQTVSFKHMPNQSVLVEDSGDWRLASVKSSVMLFVFAGVQLL
jgi:hypothetical protein